MTEITTPGPEEALRDEKIAQMADALIEVFGIADAIRIAESQANSSTGDVHDSWTSIHAKINAPQGRQQ